jgi:hypothetical protein
MGLMFLAQPVLADTRDDVWALMQRCQAIQDDRTWLDCTYGAKQPMRAKLGLPPAPDYQQRLVPPPTPDYRQRLVSAPAPSADATSKNAPPTPLPHRKASFFQILTGSAPPVAVSTLAAIQIGKQGAFVVTLQNGQVWRQVDTESGEKVRMRIGAKVTVKPGALGSYNLQTDDSSHVYKVEPRA